MYHNVCPFRYIVHRYFEGESPDFSVNNYKPLLNYVAEFHIYYSMYRALSTGIRPNRIVQQMFDARRMVVAFNGTYT